MIITTQRLYIKTIKGWFGEGAILPEHYAILLVIYIIVLRWVPTPYKLTNYTDIGQLYVDINTEELVIAFFQIKLLNNFAKCRHTQI